MRGDFITKQCILADAGMQPVHPPIPAARWKSEEVIEGTRIPKTVVRQITDPHVIGDWAIEHEATPLPNGTATIDHYGLHGARITVERHALDTETSGYYKVIMEGGIVYGAELPTADMARLRALDEALPA